MHRFIPRPAALGICLAALLSACGDSSLSGINKMLDARDDAICERNIAAYASVIAEDYQGRQQGKSEIVDSMHQLFEQFNQLKMESFGRDIYIADDSHARAAQSYRLKVLMDGSWREMLQREELTLTRSESGWQIKSGL